MNPVQLDEPLLIFLHFKTKKPHEYWIFDVRTGMYPDNRNPYITDGNISSWPFRLYKKNTRGDWGRSLCWGRNFMEAYAYALKRVSFFQRRGDRVELLSSPEYGVPVYVQPLPPVKQVFINLIDNGKTVKPQNRLKLIQELDEILSLLPVLQEMRQTLHDRELKNFGI